MASEASEHPKSDLDVEKAQAALARAGAGVDKPCPACDNREWELDPMKYFMFGVVGGEVLRDYGYGVLAVRCTRCGFVRLHSTSHLGL